MKRLIVSFTIFCIVGWMQGAAAMEMVGPPEGEAVRIVSLEEALDLASRKNPTFKSIEESVFQADAMIQGAWAMLLPNISARGSITRNEHEVLIGFPNFGELQSSDGSGYFTQQDFFSSILEIPIQDKWGRSFGVSLNTTLFNPRSIPAIRLAYDASDQSKVEAQIHKNDLLFAVTSSFYLVYSTKEMIDVTKENLETAERFKTGSDALVRTGQATRIDVLRAEIQVLSIQKELADAEDALAMTKTALAYLTGIEGPFDISTPRDVPPVGSDLSSLKAEALNKRVELKAASLAQSVSKRAKHETLTKFLPVFDLTFAWNWNSAAGFTGDNESWMLIFGAQWDLFQGGARISEYKTRNSQMRQADHNLNQVALNIRQEVDEGYTDVRKRQRNLDIIDKQLELAETNHNLVAKQYEVGVVSSLDLLSASTELANKRREKVLAKLGYDLAVLTLKKAVGTYSSLAIVPLD